VRKISGKTSFCIARVYRALQTTPLRLVPNSFDIRSNQPTGLGKGKSIQTAVSRAQRCFRNPDAQVHLP
jgi:hypothetical protein